MLPKIVLKTFHCNISVPTYFTTNKRVFRRAKTDTDRGVEHRELLTWSCCLSSGWRIAGHVQSSLKVSLRPRLTMTGMKQTHCCPLMSHL